MKNTAHSVSFWRFLSPVALARTLWAARDLIRQFTARDIEGRYRGSFFGLVWSFINPLTMLAIYTYVFGVIFKLRWPGASTDSLAEFAVVMYCGIAVYGVFSETISKSCSVVVQNPGYVKRVVLPLETLPVSMLLSSLFHGAINLAIGQITPLPESPI